MKLLAPRGFLTGLMVSWLGLPGGVCMGSGATVEVAVACCFLLGLLPGDEGGVTACTDERALAGLLREVTDLAMCAARMSAALVLCNESIES